MSENHKQKNRTSPTPFWITFYGLPCKITAASEWKAYFQKYFSGTEILFTLGRVRGPYTSLIIHDTPSGNGTIFHAVYSKLECHITVQRLDHSVYPMISNVLQRLYTRLIYQHGGFVIHASAVLRNNKAHIFLGHSGAGKTTIAKISERQHYPVLADNFVFINKEKNGYVLYPFPFDQFHNREKREPVQITCVYTLHKSTLLRIKPIEENAFGNLLQEHLQVHVPHDKHVMVPLILLLNFFRSVSIYELYFPKNYNFWEVIP